MTSVYIVRRESADACEEIDVFAGTPIGWELAIAWAACIGSRVEEESFVDMDTLEVMMRTYREAEDGPSEDAAGEAGEGASYRAAMLDAGRGHLLR